MTAPDAESVLKLRDAQHTGAACTAAILTVFIVPPGHSPSSLGASLTGSSFGADEQLARPGEPVGALELAGSRERGSVFDR